MRGAVGPVPSKLAQRLSATSGRSANLETEQSRENAGRNSSLLIYAEPGLLFAAIFRCLLSFARDRLTTGGNLHPQLVLRQPRAPTDPRTRGKKAFLKEQG